MGPIGSRMEVSGHLVGSTAFKAAGTGDPRSAGSIPVHLRDGVPRRSRLSEKWPEQVNRAGGFVGVREPFVECKSPCKPQAGLETYVGWPWRGASQRPARSRGKRVVDPITGSFSVVDRASPGTRNRSSTGPAVCGSRRSASLTATSAGRPAGPGSRPRRPGIGMSGPPPKPPDSHPWRRDSAPTRPSVRCPAGGSTSSPATGPHHDVEDVRRAATRRRGPPRQRRGAPAPTGAGRRVPVTGDRRRRRPAPTCVLARTGGR